MVIKKSEYQKQFKACIIKKNHAAYLENLNLRHQRRDREFMHTPIYWEELNNEDENVSSDCSEEGQPRSAKAQTDREIGTPYQSLAEIMADAREKADAARKHKPLEVFDKSNNASQEQYQQRHESYTNGLSSGHGELKKTEKEECYNKKSEKEQLAKKSDSFNDFIDDENRKLNKKLALTHVLAEDRDNKDASHVDDNKHLKTALKEGTQQPSVNGRKAVSGKKKDNECAEFSKQKHSSRTDRSCVRSHSSAHLRKQIQSSHLRESKHTEPSVPPLSYLPRVRRPDRQAQIPSLKSAPVSPERPMKDRPPFVAYGIGDKENSLATHRTHNVRAPVDVYPDALRAKTRREEQHRNQKENIHRARSAEVLINKLTVPSAQDLTNWQSEYRKQFHGYEPKDYQKAIDSHAVIPRSSPVQAVHRGGCLLVHVD